MIFTFLLDEDYGDDSLTTVRKQLKITCEKRNYEMKFLLFFYRFVAQLEANSMGARANSSIIANNWKGEQITIGSSNGSDERWGKRVFTLTAMLNGNSVPSRACHKLLAIADEFPMNSIQQVSSDSPKKAKI